MITEQLQKDLRHAARILVDSGALDVYLVRRFGQLHLVWHGKENELVGSYHFDRNKDRPAEFREMLEADLKAALVELMAPPKLAA